MIIMKKSPLSFTEMIFYNFGFLGIQFGWALQMANMSGIYKFLGASASDMPLLWVAAPLTGMIIQPILGRCSDSTWTKLGRRRPYILFGAIVTSIILLLMPNSPSLWFAASLLWLLDASINATMQPFRALVADVAPEFQHTRCYAIQACLVGVGASLAYSLPWCLLHLGIEQTTIPGTIPLSLKLSFYIGAVVLLVTNLFTVMKTKEYPPETTLTSRSAFSWHALWQEVTHLPTAMQQLSLVQFFTWCPLFCFFLYFGVGTAEVVYHLPFNADLQHNLDHISKLEQGLALGGICSALYTFVSLIYAYILPYICTLITRKKAHALSLCIGGIGFLSLHQAHSAAALYAAMVAMGILWASIITLPYAMLASSLPAERRGLYMGLFNITICLPQVIAAFTLGHIVKSIFHNNAMDVIAYSGIFLLIAAAATLRVEDKEVRIVKSKLRVEVSG
jgi:maltose/moltooligosaccharide transporter